MEQDGINPDLQAKIKRIIELEKEEGEVLYLNANVSDRTDLDKAIKKAEKNFGRIDGIIHAAGIVHGDSINPIGQLEKKEFEILNFECLI